MMEDQAPFAGRSVVVTGASSGIGYAIADALARGGATVFGLGRKPELPGPFASDGDARAGSIAYRRVDLADDAAIAGFSETVSRQLSGLDILVHNAGILGLGPVAATPVAELDQHYRINVRAPYLLTQALLPMLRGRRGQIVFMNSSVYGNPRGQNAAYTTSKYALKALADCLRAEVNPEGVRVLSVFPGRTASAMQADLHLQEGRPYRPAMLSQPEDIAAAVLGALALPRTSELTDIHIRPLRPADRDNGAARTEAARAVDPATGDD